MQQRYVLLDVFTTNRLEGNPLAVFPDGRTTDGELMQRIARELNLAETVFVLPPADATNAARLRIFTPARELTFAGHPTIGTAAALFAEGRITSTAFMFEEPVGAVPVRVENAPGESTRFWLTTPPVTFGETVSASACAEALALDESDLLDVPAGYASAGSPFLFVALRDAAAVDRAVFNPHRLPAPSWPNVIGIFIFAPLDGARVYSRMFAPLAGIPEDPATGGATGPLAAYLMQNGLVPAGTPTRFVSEQGVKMGRRSVLHVCISYPGAEPVIEVGGSAVRVAEGLMVIPRQS